MQIKLSDHFTYKKMLRFTLPSVMMMIFTSIYGVVDGFFISNYVGAIPFAAVNLIMPFLMLLATVGFMFGTGGSALVAMLLGRGEKERANGIFSFLVYVLAAVGIIFTVLGFVFLPEVSRMLGASEEMLPYCVMYGRIVLFSLTLFMLQISFQDYLVVAERPKLGFYTTLAAGCTKMLLDAFLVGYL
ncbi:MATE family efflux transporter [Schwartzia succinivorans]|uniref:MATE family efflux transporter n=1 Tax=Schwartzia succinivorans TaxID=55507 RepID=UPI002354343E|nr:MATE family efflux transporter [Schwartzia succinivorans]